MTNSFAHTKLWIGIFCGLIFLVEITAPVEYVFGYLYIIPILLAACELNNTSVLTRVSSTSIVTKIVISLTLLDLITSIILQIVMPHVNNLPISVIINRLNVVIILWLTDWLVKRNLKYIEEIYQKREEINYHKAELAAQIRIDRIHRDFIYTLTHDLKTPLLGGIQTIKYFQQEKFGPVSFNQSQVLDKMSRSQKISLQLVRTLLDIYRNDSEGLVLQRQPIDLRSIAREAIDIMVILGLERQIVLNLKCAESINQKSKLTGDRLQLSRVFSNLLSNAIYHSPRGGQIDVTIDDLDFQYIIVSVFDRGLGISPADLPFLFDRFYQAHQRVQGSGLGLYLSRQIVEAHGGKIWAEAGLPQGTKFCFSLPIGI